MAVCCHHRCEWRWYCGRNWLEGLGIAGVEFQLMVSIAGWATCGNGPRSAKPRQDHRSRELGRGDGVDTGSKAQDKVGETSIPEKADRTSPASDALDANDNRDGGKADCGPLGYEAQEGDDEHKCVNVEQERHGRYQAMGLSPERRREIGYMVKSILDEGRLRYLRSMGMTADRVNFISQTYTPENFAIVATAPMTPQ